MKTALTELVDFIEQRDIPISKDWLKILLEKEKQHIIDACNIGIHHGGKLISTGEQYFNQTFNTKEGK
jgi:hypothetical protein